MPILYSNLLSVIYVMYLCSLVQQLCNASLSALHIGGLNCQYTSLSFFCLIKTTADFFGWIRIYLYYLLVTILIVDILHSL